jgi:SOS-response transcriptional repressor LexA
LTPHQREALMTIHEFISEHEYPPTNRELGLILGHASTGTTARSLQRLLRAGAITYIYGCPRTIVITPHGREIIAGEAL